MKNLYLVISRRITIITIAFLLTYVPSCAIGVTSAVTSTKESGNAPTSERTASTTATFPLDGTEIIRTVTPTHLISTPTLAAAYSTVLVGANILLLEGTGTGVYYLFDLDRGSGRYLTTERDLIIQVVDWTRDGCSLIVLLSNGEIVEIDLSGKIMHSFFSKDLIPAQDQPEVKTLPDISPSKDWIAYRIVSGELSVDPQTMQERYAVQELYTLQINNPEQTHQLTKHGGAYASAWAPDGQSIAFLDYDQGVLHLYTSRPDGSQKQIVAPVPYHYQQIIRVEWPQDDQITLTYYQDQEQPETVSTYVFGKRSFDLPMQEILWWRDAATPVILSRKVGQEGVFLYDVKSTSIILEIPFSRFKQKNHIGVYRHSSVTGFFSEEGFTTYNTDNQSFAIYPNSNYSSIPGIGFIQNWYAPPDNFYGERFCRN